MPLSWGMGMLPSFSGPVPEEDENTESGHAQTGNRSQPRIKLLGNDVPRCIKSHSPQQIYARRVRSGDDDSEQHGMSCSAARPHKIGCNDRLAMSWLQGMKRAQTCSDQSRREQHPETQ